MKGKILLADKKKSCGLIKPDPESGIHGNIFFFGNNAVNFEEMEKGDQVIFTPKKSRKIPGAINGTDIKKY